MTMTAITGAHVVPMTGDAYDGCVLFDETGIISAQAGVQPPADAHVVEAGDAWVLPGLVDAHTHVGICEEGGGDAGDDTNEMTDPVTAKVRALDAINPEDLGFTDSLSGGVTTVNILPGSANVIGGLCVAMSAAGRTVDEMVLRSPSGMKSALGENPKRVYGSKKQLPSTRLGVAAVLREALYRTASYMAKVDKGEDYEVDLTCEHLSMVLRGQIPWRQHVHRPDDIATAFRLADEFGYELVLDHATEGYLVADLIAERGVPVLYGPLMSNRSKLEVARQSMSAPGILAAAGVQVSIITDPPIVPAEYLITQVALAMRDGLPERDALATVTTSSAKVLGLADQIGSLGAGMRADLAIWSGDPLLISSRVLTTFVGGKRVYDYAG